MSNNHPYFYVWEAEVRDNELDFQGIVNNANYFIYLAHARHKCLKELGIDILAMHDHGFDLVLIRSEIDFKDSLKGGDEFIVTAKIEPMGRIRFVFIQQILRKTNRKLMLEAKNIGVCIDRTNRKPIIPSQLKSIFSLNSSDKN